MMNTLFGDLAPWFSAPALLGTGFLLIQLVLGELGGDGALDVDLDVDLNGDHPGAEFGSVLPADQRTQPPRLPHSLVHPRRRRLDATGGNGQFIVA